MQLDVSASLLFLEATENVAIDRPACIDVGSSRLNTYTACTVVQCRPVTGPRAR
jgi:hypothetical protein